MNDKINGLLTEQALKEKLAKDEAYKKNLDQVVNYQVVGGWENLVLGRYCLWSSVF